MTLNEIRNIFGTILVGWKADDIPGFANTVLLTDPNGEKSVAVLMGTTVTGTERPKPQIRLFTDKIITAYEYAVKDSLKFFCFVLCTSDVNMLKFPPTINTNHYLLSIESKFDHVTGGRLDLRSFYDNIERHLSDDSFRVLKSEHNLATLVQGIFFRLCDSAGVIDPVKVINLEKYIRFFDNRPYMNTAATGSRVVYRPSALYAPSAIKDNLPPWNWLVFGAPGTGKSYFLKEQIEKFNDRIKPNGVEFHRITFYEDYTYSQFVGCYMPEPDENLQQDIYATNGSQTFEGTIMGEHITYRFSPGPFAIMLAKAFVSKLKNEEKKYILVIEELNRANAASVFGDIFQLLDRDKGISTYEISLPEAFSNYIYETISDELPDGAAGITVKDLQRIKLPDNLYIWATMNSADQGVFPLDSAFKRRWTPLYRDIDYDDPANMMRPLISLPYLENDGTLHIDDLDWNTFRGEINRIILSSGFEEDRCIGYWFFSEEEMVAIKTYSECSVKAYNGDQDAKTRLQELSSPLTDKLLAYLRQDVFRSIPTRFFKDEFKNMSAIRRGIKTLKESTGKLIDLKGMTMLTETAFIVNQIATTNTEAVSHDGVKETVEQNVADDSQAKE